ncbi:hypothetical protein ABDJ41_06130 [Pedobacter sp. ASV1-7]|uniref:hypothetical protein n=1 Tax=Pedobacter sp. ASV1-7 TaxID=3145237 RepID=UPI0032E87382
MSVTTTIRMYNQKNLGDCFLLKFQAEGKNECFVLIDFGSYTGNKDRERLIAEDIRKTVEGKKLTVVLTHQHKDHISGFGTSEDILQGLPSELWLSFLDDENSKEGQLLRELTQKYWKKNEKVKKLVGETFPNNPKVKAMMKAKEGFDLFAEGQSNGAAMSSLLKLAGDNTRFLTPGDSFFLPGTDNEIKVYVLGPPVDKNMLTKLDPNNQEEVSGLNISLEMTNMDISGTLMLEALNNYGGVSGREANFPFNAKYIGKHSNETLMIKTLYEEEQWRKIDHDWLSEIGRLSLHMDSLTNNTSLVLAFEMVKSRKVLLFVGDAQIGNWQSWFNVKFKDSTVNGQDLLSRTVVYKAGHHSSHNATLKQGLELMNKKDLTILIPVDESISTKQGFLMLKPDMLMGYHRQSNGRVLRSDTIEQSGEKFTLDFPFAKRADLKNLKVNEDETGNHLSIELTIEDKVQRINTDDFSIATNKTIDLSTVPKIKIKPRNRRKE